MGNQRAVGVQGDGPGSVGAQQSCPSACKMGGQLRGEGPTMPGREHRVNGLEVPDHDPARTGAILGLGTLLLPLGFQTLQHRWDPARVWVKAAPHSWFSSHEGDV